MNPRVNNSFLFHEHPLQDRTFLSGKEQQSSTTVYLFCNKANLAAAKVSTLF